MMDFIYRTKYYRESLGGKSLDWSKKPEIYKEYLNVKTVKLPNPKEKEIKLTFHEIIRKRKSVREFIPKNVKLEDLSFILWVTTGFRETLFGYDFRTVPSAGALYPIETYIIAKNIEGIEKGIYHYNIKNHLLELLEEGDFSKNVAISSLHQYFISNASFIIIWSAIFYRTLWKYDERGLRYIFIEAGHIAQNFALSCVACGLGSCQIGAFFDDELNELLGLDGKNESVIYLSCAGYPY